MLPFLNWEHCMLKLLFPLCASNVVRRGGFVRGDVKFNGTVKISGHLEGSLSVSPNDCVFVAHQGVLRSDNLTMDTLVVKGAVYAKHIKVRRLVIRSGGEVHGRIEAQSLTVHPSSRYDGHVTLCAPPAATTEGSSAKIAKERLESMVHT